MLYKQGQRMKPVSTQSFIDSLMGKGIPENVAKEAASYPINAYQELLDCNNCYSYGVGDLFLHADSLIELKQNNYVPYIGDVSGIRRKEWNMYTMDHDVIGYMEDDGAYFVSKDKPAPITAGYQQIFIASDIRGYGHVYRQNADGSWSHKLGVQDWVSGFADKTGKHGLIENPYKSFRMEYNMPIGFFQIKLGRQIGIKGYENKIFNQGCSGITDYYIRSTQNIRNKCADLNLKFARIDKSPLGLEDPDFKSMCDEYVSLKDRFNEIYKKEFANFNRYKLLQTQELRNAEQFMY